MNEHELLTIEEVAKMLRVSEHTIEDWADKNEIPCGKFGTTWRFERSEVTKWIEKRLNTNSRPVTAAPLTLNSVLTPDRIIFLEDDTKESALQKLVEVLSSDSRVKSGDKLLAAIFKREELMSTGIGLGIGVPHVRIDSVDDIVMAVGVSTAPITDYESLDDEPIRIVCMIAAGSDQHAKHIKLLSAVSKRLKDTEIREQILASKSEQDVFDILTGKTNA